MFLRLLLFSFVLLLSPALATAHSISDDISVGGTSTPATTSNSNANTTSSNATHSSYVSDHLKGLWQVNDPFALHLDLTWTYDAASPPPPGAYYKESGGNIFLFDLGGDLDINDHWSLMADLYYSPPSTSSGDSLLSYMTARCMVPNPPADCNVDVQVKTTANSYGASLLAGYDTAGEGKVETAADVGVSFFYYQTIEKITAAVYQNPTTKMPMSYDVGQLLNHCDTEGAGTLFCKHNRRALMNSRKPVSLDIAQLQFSASLTETLFRDTDIGVSGSYYLYYGDPTAAPYPHFRFGGGASFGSGVALAPYWFTVRPAISHRFFHSKLSLTLSFQYGLYVSDTSANPQPANAIYSPSAGGYDITVGLKIQYKFTKKFKMWLSGTAQHDTDAANNPSDGGALTLGARLSF